MINKLEILLEAELFRITYSDEVQPISYDLASLDEVERHLTETIEDGKDPGSKSLFYKKKDDLPWRLGCYLGEVVRREVPLTSWKLDQDDVFATGIVSPEGMTGLVINKAFKRVHNGSGDNLPVFARMLINRVKEEEAVAPLQFDADDHEIARHYKSGLCLVGKDIKSEADINDVSLGSGICTISSGNHSGAEDMSELFEPQLAGRLAEHYPNIPSIQGLEGRIRMTRQPDGSFVQNEAAKGLLWDGSAMASNQGNMKFSPLQWIKYNTKSVFLKTAFLLIFAYAMLNWHWAYGILFVGSLLYNIWYWNGKRMTFAGGDVNPGLVISINPTKIAVATDMTQMVGYYPLVQIIEAKLPRAESLVGEIVPTIGVYYNNPHDYPFWAEFAPVPVVHGTGDQDLLAAKRKTYSTKDIDQLKAFRKMIGSAELGAYKVLSEGNDWGGYEHVDMNMGVRMEGPLEGNR